MGILKVTFSILFIAIPCLADWANWSFDWSVRTDGDDKPAGCYELTPFPIDENTTSYKICNDENLTGKTYYIGTISFVDGSISPQSSSDYDPSTRSCGSGSYTCYKTIAEAISATETGNRTILVRAGTYTEHGLTLKSGTGDTNRWMICGYNQERPAINGIGTVPSPNSTVVGSNAVSHATCQRLKIQDNYGNGFRFGPDDSSIAAIDLWLYGNCKYDTANSRTWADGNLYYLGSDNCWIYHCTSERTHGHGLKVGDDADNCIVEWNVVKEAGYWVDISPTVYWGNHCVALDFPADSGQTNDNLKVRYNIANTALFGTVQLRYCPNFNMHHNELYDATHMDDIDSSEYHHVSSNGSVIIHQSSTYGKFYSNIIRDNPDEVSENNAANLIGIQTINNGNSVDIYNNLIYGGERGIYFYGYHASPRELKVRIYNNSIYGNSSYGLIRANSVDPEDSVDIRNNIVYQAGSGECMDVDTDVTWDYNLYYYPSGSLGTTASTHDIDGEDPQWAAFPLDEYSLEEAALTENSPARNKGTNLSSIFTTDFHNAKRNEGWDIGYHEYDGIIGTIDHFPSTNNGVTNRLSVYVMSNGIINFLVNMVKPGDFLLSVFNVSGQRIWISKGKGKNTRIQWINPNIINGVYIVSVKQQDNKVTQTFTILR